MLKACASRMQALPGQDRLVWVDLGGGTAENVELMAEHMDLERFHKIYVVDICGPLCDVARRKAELRGWDNVEVVEADVCSFEPDSGPAQLVTFSYSLSS